MPKLPVVTGAELLRALKRSGFIVTRQRGSHVQVRRTEPVTLTLIALGLPLALIRRRR